MQTSPAPNEDGVPYKIYNIGNSHPENLLDFVEILQEELKRAKVLPQDYDLDAHKELVGMQAGDVEVTYADVSQLENDFEFKPKTDLRADCKKNKWRKNSAAFFIVIMPDVAIKYCKGIYFV